MISGFSAVAQSLDTCYARKNIALNRNYDLRSVSSTEGEET